MDSDRRDKVLKILETLKVRFPVADIVKKLEVDKGVVSAYLNGKKPISDNFYAKFIKEYESDFIKAGKSIAEPLTDITEAYHQLWHYPTQVNEDDFTTTLRNKKLTPKENRNIVPFYDAPAIAGINETEMDSITSPVGMIDVGDLLSDSHAAIRIYGNSMTPNYPPGCVVGISKVDKPYIHPGEVYVVETKNQRVLKRLFHKDDDPSSDIVSFISDNKIKEEGGARDGRLAYPPFERTWEEIEKIFIVTGVIKRNTNSMIVNRNGDL